MTPLESNWYQAFMPSIIKQGDSVRYYFSARDQAAIANCAVSNIFSYQTGIEGFELGLDFWIADSTSWQIDDKDFHTGRYCISTFPGKAYPTSQNVSIRSRFGLRRRDLQGAMLCLWTRYELEESKDFGFIEISSDHGENWMGIGDAITGIEKNWIQKCYDLGAFYLESNDTLLLRFRLQTDADQVQSLPGWFIDDIRIQPAEMVRAPENESGSQPSLPMLADFSNVPNPFNEVTRINFEINISGDVELEIFNVIGQTVFKRSMGVLPAGRHSTFWNGRDSNGATCGSGLFFCRLIFKIDASKSFQQQLSRTIKIIYLQ
jgi:hypothetical protein